MGHPDQGCSNLCPPGYQVPESCLSGQTEVPTNTETCPQSSEAEAKAGTPVPSVSSPGVDPASTARGLSFLL